MSVDFFTYPATIPIEVALSVRAVACNQANAEHWDILDFQPRQQILSWVRKIFDYNKSGNTDDNVEWFAKKLAERK